MKRLLTLGVLFVYFGYTACPDVCPTTLAGLKSALRYMGDDAGDINVAMATVDPRRDTDEIITDYDVTISDDGDYEVIHTAHRFAIDGTGHLQVTWAFGAEPETIAQDLQILLEAQWSCSG